MKITKSTFQKLLRNLERVRFERRLLQKHKKYHKRKLLSTTGSRASAPSKAKRKEKWVDLAAPVDIDLQQNRDEICKFIKTVREQVRAGVRLRLLFDNCNSIKLSALMLLLAQIHKLRLEYGPQNLTGTYPKNKRVERLLDRSGFYKLLGVKSRPDLIAVSKLNRYIRFKSDQKPNSEEIPNLRKELLGDDLQMPTTVAKLIFKALSEAMTNVNHHAYSTKSVKSIKLSGRWWMVASLSARTRLFTLTFYDAGVGIPKTLPRKYSMEKIRLALSLLPGFEPDDGQMIRAAMELGRTRTYETNRGLGLMDLAKLIMFAGAGSLHIHSRRGSYTHTPDKVEHDNHDGFVEGTLIEWQLPINKALENLPKEIENELVAHN
jgi:hypothetical protein